MEYYTELEKTKRITFVLKSVKCYQPEDLKYDEFFVVGMAGVGRSGDVRSSKPVTKQPVKVGKNDTYTYGKSEGQIFQETVSDSDRIELALTFMEDDAWTNTLAMDLVTVGMAVAGAAIGAAVGKVPGAMAGAAIGATPGLLAKYLQDKDDQLGTVEKVMYAKDLPVGTWDGQWFIEKRVGARSIPHIIEGFSPRSEQPNAHKGQDPDLDPSWSWSYVVKYAIIVE